MTIFSRPKEIALGDISGWQPPHGRVTTWTPSPAAREAVQAARRSDMPPTSQRAQHLRAGYEDKAIGRQLPRLLVAAWDIPGVCHIPAMTATINAHVRRHDAYHDWFEFENGAFVRRVIDNPEVIDFVPVDFGSMNAEQIRAHALTTPETLAWDCFTFGIVQGTDYFTFYAIVDHLGADGLSVGLIFFDIHPMYERLAAAVDQWQPSTRPQVRSYRDYAARQRDKLASAAFLKCSDSSLW